MHQGVSYASVLKGTAPKVQASEEGNISTGLNKLTNMMQSFMAMMERITDLMMHNMISASWEINFGGKGDYNAKHTHWGSRLISPKGKQLYDAIEEQSLDYLSAGNPTYYLIDFCLTKRIPRTYAKATDCYNLSCDYSPVTVTVSTDVLSNEMPNRLTNKQTNCDQYRRLVEQNFLLNIPLITPVDIDAAVENLKAGMTLSADKATPGINRSEKVNKQELIQEKQKITVIEMEVKSNY